MATALDVLAMTLRTGAAPGLRNLGFVGSGQSFELRDPKTWRLLGMQMSRTNSASRAKFTINLPSGRKHDRQAACEAHADLPVKPSPMSYAPITRTRTVRIGKLIPDGRDHWWEVSASTPPAQLAAHVLSAMEEFALPAFSHGFPDGWHFARQAR